MASQCFLEFFSKLDLFFLAGLSIDVWIAFLHLLEKSALLSELIRLLLKSLYLHVRVVCVGVHLLDDLDEVLLVDVDFTWSLCGCTSQLFCVAIQIVV